MVATHNIQGLDKETVQALAAKYHLKRFAIFGSFARGEETEKSDVDVLVEWTGAPGWGGFMGLIEDIEKITGRRVDLASEDALHWYIKHKILADAKDLL